MSLYEFISYLSAQILGLDILRYSYTLLFELCVAVYTFSEGKYHCKYIRWSALGVFSSDTISRIDYYFDILPVFAYNYLLAFVIGFGIILSCLSSISIFTK